MSVLPSTGDGAFDLQSWNEYADSVLLADVQSLAIASLDKKPASASHGVGNFNIMILQQRHIMSSAPSPKVGVMGPRILRTVCFAIASAIVNDLLPAINAGPEERMQKFGIVIAKAMAAAAAAGLTAKALEALEKGLVRNAEVIMKSSARKVMAIVPITPVYNAFKSLWYYITSLLTSSPELSQNRKDACAALWSVDSLVTQCATTVVAVSCVAITSSVATSPVVLGVLEALLFYALQSVVELVVTQKNERGGWWAWLCMWILPEELRAWTGDKFDQIEMELTDALRCPITGNLVVDPVVGPFLPGSRPHVYERVWLYRHLKTSGKDPLTNHFQAGLVAPPKIKMTRRTCIERAFQNLPARLTHRTKRNEVQHSIHNIQVLLPIKFHKKWI